MEKFIWKPMSAFGGKPKLGTRRRIQLQAYLFGYSCASIFDTIGHRASAALVADRNTNAP